MRIFVTGGAGFIGSNFIRYVLETKKDFSIVNFDKLTYAGNLANLESIADNPNNEFVKGDICDAAAVEAAMRGCDALIHFAAESHVDRSIYEPAPVIQTNVTGTFILLEVARKISLSRFVHVSTDEVYGDIPPGSLPMKISRFSRAVRTPPRRQPLISWFGRTSVPTGFPQ